MRREGADWDDLAYLSGATPRAALRESFALPDTTRHVDEQRSRAVSAPRFEQQFEIAAPLAIGESKFPGKLADAALRNFKVRRPGG